MALFLQIHSKTQIIPVFVCKNELQGQNLLEKGLVINYSKVHEYLQVKINLPLCE